MKSQEFLRKKLTELSFKFDDIKIRYEYRQNTKSHIVEIIPLSVYNNSEYMMVENELEDEFEQLFFNEEIVFVSENSLTEINIPDFTLGYDSFVVEIPYMEMIVYGFSTEVNSYGDECYALAA